MAASPSHSLTEQSLKNKPSHQLLLRRSNISEMSQRFQLFSSFAWSKLCCCNIKLTAEHWGVIAAYESTETNKSELPRVCHIICVMHVEIMQFNRQISRVMKQEVKRRLCVVCLLPSDDSEATVLWQPSAAPRPLQTHCLLFLMPLLLLLHLL